MSSPIARWEASALHGNFAFNLRSDFALVLHDDGSLFLEVAGQKPARIAFCGVEHLETAGGMGLQRAFVSADAGGGRIG